MQTEPAIRAVPAVEIGSETSIQSRPESTLVQMDSQPEDQLLLTSETSECHSVEYCAEDFKKDAVFYQGPHFSVQNFTP